jgi:hypothetical protein
MALVCMAVLAQVCKARPSHQALISMVERLCFRTWIFATTLARKHRGQTIAGTFTPTATYHCEASLPLPWRQSGDSLPCDSSPATLQPIIVRQGKTHGYWSVIGICPPLSIPLAFGFVYVLPIIILQYSSFGS